MLRTTLISERRLKKKVKEIANLIKRDYEGKEPLLLCVLKGSFVFLSDLVRNLSFPHEIEFLRVASYGKRSVSTGKIEWIMKPRIPIKGRHCIVVEDIVDTGYTLKEIYNFIKKRNPKSLKLCVLLDKRERRKVKIKIDYKGFEVPDKFLVGYGLDFNEKFRYIKNIQYINGEISNARKKTYSKSS